MTAKLVWITPDTEKLIAQMARVSNPANQNNPSFSGLLKYMVKNKHWSPFEMASACFEITTTRDIARQILRHRSFSFQEFSQRYADVFELESPSYRECRLQDTTNRQNSLSTQDQELSDWWKTTQDSVVNECYSAYELALSKGIAKEQARCLLPEGLTTSRMYMTGSIRSWMHYCQLRTEAGTQKEHREVAQAISDVLKQQLPTIWSVLNEQS